MKRLRVAHIITRLCKGGAQENTFHTVRLTNSERFEAHLIAGHPEGAEGSMEAAIEAAGVSIRRVPSLVRHASPFSDLRCLHDLVKLFRAERYDIVHTHTSKAGFLGRLAAKITGIPVVVHTPHGNIFHGYFKRMPTTAYVVLERFAARWTDRLIELTQLGVEESLDQRIGRRDQYSAIFSGIDLGRFENLAAGREEARMSLGVGNDEFLVGTVGRLEPVKGIEYFVAAAHRITENAPGARCVVVGQGSEEEALRERAQGVTPEVRFLGHRDDVPQLMAAFDVLVVPSVNEGMGRVVLEAGAAATPVVASDVGGVPDVVRDGETGFLVPPGDDVALAERVVELAKDPVRRQRMGEAGREFVVPSHGLDEMVRRIEAVYEEVIEEKVLDL